MSPVTIVIARVLGPSRILGNEVPAMDIIDIAIAIVINPVSRDFTTIGPKIIDQVRVAHIHTGINNGHRHRRAAARLGTIFAEIVPGFRDFSLFEIGLGGK